MAHTFATIYSFQTHIKLFIADSFRMKIIASNATNFPSNVLPKVSNFEQKL